MTKLSGALLGLLLATLATSAAAAQQDPNTPVSSDTVPRLMLPADLAPGQVDSAVSAIGATQVQLGTGAPLEDHAVPGGPTQPAAAGYAIECGHHGDDFITPHLMDSRCLDYPGFPKFWEVHSVALPQWPPVRIGNFEIDLSPTKHVVFLLLAAFLSSLMLIWAAVAHKRHSHEGGHPKGFAAGIEALVLYLRNEVAVPNLGPHGEKYAPFILTLFFFILFGNLLGLIPYGATATGNINVTATLAIITFFVVEFAGIRANGIGYLNTIFYWNKDLPLAMRIPMFIIMSPVEMIGKFTKPFALAIRLFANMTAGHIIVLALIGLIFTFRSYVIGLAPMAMAVAIMMLELFVAFLQAFIFSLLASVFIGQIRSAHH
jgi:F-type H+-transporting ATPase subunit a